MIQRLSHVTIIVKDIDEALDFYTQKLGFDKVMDAPMGPGMRWVTVAPRGQKDVEIVLQKPSPEMQGEAEAKEMMKQVGHGTAWVFRVDSCRKTCDELRKKGIQIVREPEVLPFGTEAIFVDLYGNPFILMEPPAAQG
jgi:predicted enzyme related to lactoylglutathione lyase